MDSGFLDHGEIKAVTYVESELFSSREADLVLVSSDDIEFRVFSRILIEASTIFQDMVRIGDSSQSTAGQNRIPLSENGETLELVFQFIYPLPDPKITSFDTLKRLMDTADKYFLRGMMHSLKELLILPRFVEPQPLRAYALACMHGLHEEAKTISRFCLKIDILQQGELYEELAMISGRDLLRLIKLHQSRGTSITAILNNSSPSPCTGIGATPGVPLWWTEFRARAKEELRSRPLGDTIFQPKFLATCVTAAAANGCSQCALNYLSNATQARLDQIRGLIEVLPDTV